jgi:hypothetical protein
VDSHRGWILALSALLFLQITAALIWQKWFRRESPSIQGVIPQMQQLVRERLYDDAVQLGLRSLSHSSNDDSTLQQIAVVYLRRAQIEAGNKERDTAQAVDYAQQALAANPANQANLYATARVLDIAGDFSAPKRCDYYRRSLALFQERTQNLEADQIMVGNKMVSTTPLRQENEYLLQRVQSKIAKAGCG